MLVMLLPAHEPVASRHPLLPSETEERSVEYLILRLNLGFPYSQPLALRDLLLLMQSQSYERSEERLHSLNLAVHSPEYPQPLSIQPLVQI